MKSALGELGHAWRMMVRYPGFAVPCVLVLALAIGVNTAVFSVVNQVLLQPLPFKESDRLVRIHQTHPVWGDSLTASLPVYRDWRELRGTVFDEVGAFARKTVTVRGGVRPERIETAAVTAGVFRMLGALPQAGRLLSDADEALGAPLTVVVSQGLLERIFAGDREVTGRTIQVDGRSAVVIGVAPAGFRFPLSEPVQMWTALQDDPNAGRDQIFLQVLGRLKRGVSVAHAQARLSGLAERLPLESPEDERLGVRVTPWKEELVSGARAALLLLMGAVGLVLLTACVNLGSLGLAQGERRRPEIAVRSALGASRWRLGRQLLAESAVIALAGGAVGFFLAHAATKALQALRPADLAPWADIAPDLWALLFTSVVSMASGVLVGVIPAVGHLRGDLSLALKEAGRAGRGSSRLSVRHGLAAVQVALAVALVACAALLIESFWRLRVIDTGFDPAQVVTARVWFSEEADANRRRLFYERLLERTADLPGVVCSGAIQTVPLGPGHWQSFLAVQGRDFPENATPVADFRIVAGDYFDAMGIPILRGRGFSPDDREGSVAVAIVNEALARRHWPKENPLRKRIAATGAEGPDSWASIVGVVKDVTQSGLAVPERPAVYRPFRQRPVAAMDLVVRSSKTPAALIPALQATVWEIDRDVPSLKVVPMDELVAASASEARYQALLMTAFAVLALVLGLLGTYSVMSRAVMESRHEIGIRMALGAEEGAIRRLFLVRGAAVAAVGVSAGLAGGFLLGGFLETLLFGASGGDPTTFLAVGALMTAAVLLACYVPSRRASRMDAAAVLRRN